MRTSDQHQIFASDIYLPQRYSKKRHKRLSMPSNTRGDMDGHMRSESWFNLSIPSFNDQLSCCSEISRVNNAGGSRDCSYNHLDVVNRRQSLQTDIEQTDNRYNSRTKFHSSEITKMVDQYRIKPLKFGTPLKKYHRYLEKVRRVRDSYSKKLEAAQSLCLINNQNETIQKRASWSNVQSEGEYEPNLDFSRKFYSLTSSIASSQILFGDETSSATICNAKHSSKDSLNSIPSIGSSMPDEDNYSKSSCIGGHNYLKSMKSRIGSKLVAFRRSWSGFFNNNNRRNDRTLTNKILKRYTEYGYLKSPGREFANDDWSLPDINNNCQNTFRCNSCRSAQSTSSTLKLRTMSFHSHQLGMDFVRPPLVQAAFSTEQSAAIDNFSDTDEDHAYDDIFTTGSSNVTTRRSCQLPIGSERKASQNISVNTDYYNSRSSPVMDRIDQSLEILEGLIFKISTHLNGLANTTNTEEICIYARNS
ncbi:hypothetical protein GZH46_02206 [Fragariocoptes setiger]|uniref:Uncharacterized protein n=1 Tax=Fragariocoptes setiger TaxID=1670756 RepID=A0ABQ7S779_9ACAR|nr:hypothetical protein GZH46_02206 [Fragariocoptes setiger]